MLGGKIFEQVSSSAHSLSDMHFNYAGIVDPVATAGETAELLREPQCELFSNKSIIRSKKFDRVLRYLSYSGTVFEARQKGRQKKRRKVVWLVDQNS